MDVLCRRGNDYRRARSAECDEVAVATVLLVAVVVAGEPASRGRRSRDVLRRLRSRVSLFSAPRPVVTETTRQPALGNSATIDREARRRSDGPTRVAQVYVWTGWRPGGRTDGRTATGVGYSDVTPAAVTRRRYADHPYIFDDEPSSGDDDIGRWNRPPADAAAAAG